MSKTPFNYLRDCATGEDEVKIIYNGSGKDNQDKQLKPFMPGPDGKHPITAKPNDEPS